VVTESNTDQSDNMISVYLVIHVVLLRTVSDINDDVLVENRTCFHIPVYLMPIWLLASQSRRKWERARSPFTLCFTV